MKPNPIFLTISELINNEELSKERLGKFEQRQSVEAKPFYVYKLPSLKRDRRLFKDVHITIFSDYNSASDETDFFYSPYHFTTEILNNEIVLKLHVYFDHYGKELGRRLMRSDNTAVEMNELNADEVEDIITHIKTAFFEDVISFLQGKQEKLATDYHLLISNMLLISDKISVNTVSEFDKNYLEHLEEIIPIIKRLQQFSFNDKYYPLKLFEERKRILAEKIKSNSSAPAMLSISQKQDESISSSSSSPSITNNNPSKNARKKALKKEKSEIERLDKQIDSLRKLDRNCSNFKDDLDLLEKKLCTLALFNRENDKAILKVIDEIQLVREELFNYLPLAATHNDIDNFVVCCKHFPFNYKIVLNAIEHGQIDIINIMQQIYGNSYFFIYLADQKSILYYAYVAYSKNRKIPRYQAMFNKIVDILTCKNNQENTGIYYPDFNTEMNVLAHAARESNAEMFFQFILTHKMSINVTLNYSPRRVLAFVDVNSNRARCQAYNLMTDSSRSQNSNHSILYFAAQGGHSAIIKYLLNKLDEKIINSVCFDNNHVLFHYLFNKNQNNASIDTNIVMLFLEKMTNGTVNNYIHVQDNETILPYETTLLIFAITKGLYEVAELFIDKGADVSQKTRCRHDVALDKLSALLIVCINLQRLNYELKQGAQLQDKINGAINVTKKIIQSVSFDKEKESNNLAEDFKQCLNCFYNCLAETTSENEKDILTILEYADEIMQRWSCHIKGSYSSMERFSEETLTGRVNIRLFFNPQLGNIQALQEMFRLFKEPSSSNIPTVSTEQKHLNFS